LSAENKPKLPNYKEAFEGGGGMSETERGAIALPLITKDKNLETKTKIPDAFVMAVLDTFEPMSKGEILTVEQLMKTFGERYRVNAMSEQGWSTGNYVAVASAPLSLTDARVAEAQERLKEGNKK
jgi:hypothetical protein